MTLQKLVLPMLLPCLLAASWSRAAGGQAAPAGRSSTSADAPSAAVAVAQRLVAAGDSLGAIRSLQAAVEKDRRDAQAWHALGMLAWEYTRHAKSSDGLFMAPQMARIRLAADTALRLAAELARNNAGYWYDVAKFSLNTGNTFVRAGAPAFLDNAAEHAASAGDSALLSRVRDEQGMRAWRLYENIANRALPGMVPDVGRTPNPLATPARPTVMPGTALPVETRRDQWNQYFGEMLQKLDPPVGFADYRKAYEAFDEAVRFDATNAAAWNHAFMARVEKQRWSELEQLANRALAVHPSRPDGWLARALAMARTHRMADAAAAFDSAFARMDRDRQATYTSLDRLLAPHSTGKRSLIPDSVAYAKATPEQRARADLRFWYLYEPRASTAFNEAKLEFQARIVEADLLWSSEDMEVRGADSDRGRVLIRYGPPDDVFNVARELTNPMLVWIYKRGPTFIFDLVPSYGVAYTPRLDKVAQDSMIEELPLSWSNVRAVQRTVPMQLRAARFRGAADSMDVVVAAAIPTLALFDGTPLSGALPIDVFLEVNDPMSRVVGRQAQRTSVDGSRMPSSINAWWERRLSTGLNVVRVEAEQKDVERSAVGSVEVDIPSAVGFGLSDLLFTGVPAADARATSSPARWTDVDIKPTIGAFASTVPVGILWENYGLASDNGVARYRVTLEVERTFARSVRGLGARVVANFRNVLQGNVNGAGGFSLSYEESRPHAGAIADLLSIKLEDSAPGTYRMKITVLDLVSKQATSRSADFRLVQ